MDAAELYETTMNPEKRRLVQLTTDNLDRTLSLYDELMGKHADLRRNFILRNGLNGRGEDDLFDDFDDADE